MRAFIVRPFGLKEGIDFDRVERELVQPALARLQDLGFSVKGGTTGEITRQGNIREDMFRLLVLADLVIADVTIHNANAFYELGIRHALRPAHTFLIRSLSQDSYPFDLQTDRYFQYDAAHPAASIEALAKALRDTLVRAGGDSPVFQLLPDLKAHGRGALVKLPTDFIEDVERAQRNRRRGDLRLFAHEVQSCDWDQEGLRRVGQAQLKLRDFSGARETFETLRAAVPDDLESNLRLGTIFQRLALAEAPDRREDLLAGSDQAIRRALGAAATPGEQAEALSLLGSNEKSRLIDELHGAPPETRRATALRSTHLEAALGHYLKAAVLDLNAHYPGVNALAMLNVQTSLARALPDVWQQGFDDDEQAAKALAAREKLASRVTSSLCLALGMDETAAGDGTDPDPWAAASRADLLLFTVSNRPQRVAQAYRQALADADRFALEATRRNLDLYRDLGLFDPNLAAVLQVVDDAFTGTVPPRPTLDRVVLFTGHMIDAPARSADKARFPATEQAEATARRLIENAVRDEVPSGSGNTLGIAGGASGGDILFHEVCMALNVPTHLYLALPANKFQVSSVQRGGPRWVERYQRLCERLDPRVLQPSETLPRWLADVPGYDVWQRNNLWMMFNAIATGARRLTLIALYNPEQDPDGPGGTASQIAQARSWGFKSVELDARELLPG
jgi:Tetratricopeptide Repeats-Sensor